MASASPRRREILSALGVPFKVSVPDIDEKKLASNAPGPEALAETLALSKARAVYKSHPDSLVLGADTLVCLEDKVLGKPQGADDARRMLMALRGRSHKVITGLALVPPDPGKPLLRHTSTTVTMRLYSEAEVEDYIASGNPLDKAGAYAVQSAGFHPAERVKGCYWNVVGLPLCLLVDMLSQVEISTEPDTRAVGLCMYQDCPLQA
ncbi:MAG: Maf family protein [Dehalococcoidia bacterium]